MHAPQGHTRVHIHAEPLLQGLAPRQTHVAPHRIPDTPFQGCTAIPPLAPHTRQHIQPSLLGYDHTLTGETWGLEGGQDLKLNPAPPSKNERENTSYDVATLQDEEGELPEFPGETPTCLPPAYPHPPPCLGPQESQL